MSKPGWLAAGRRLKTPQREAGEWYVRLRATEGDATGEVLSAFMRWAEHDPQNSAAFRAVAENWDALAAHAATEQLMAWRRDSLEDACRAQRRRGARGQRRWIMMAASVCGMIILGVALWTYMGSRPVMYSTGIGERRSINLPDGSTLILDACSRVAASYDSHSRSFSLEAGHARFEVAADASRPFRVRAGDETVHALGTQFDVEIMSDAVLVTLLEGKVAVTETPPGMGTADAAAAPASPAIEMTPGDQLVAAGHKPRTIRRAESLAYASAWTDGKLIFANEPLGRAVERVNRYSHERIKVDPEAADVTIGGIFNAGDSAAFVEAVTAYLPITQERSVLNELTLKVRKP